MSHRIFRLSIAPDDAPEVRRVLDFDGRNSLHDVHEVMSETLSIGDDDHLYAFFLSGRYWDKSSEYVDPRTDGARADQALLFRLRLKAGQRFVYVYDYGEEHRYTLTVVSVTEAQAALPSPVLIESVGEAPVSLDGLDFDAADEHDEAEPNPALEEPFRLAAAVVEQARALEDLLDDAAAEETRPLLRKLGDAALAFALELDGNLQLLTTVSREFELVELVLDLPGRLSLAGETDLAVRLAEALQFCAADEMKGEVALAYARSGARQRALELVLTNLETALDPFIAEYKAGDVYRELGEADAAEAYYRRSLAVAETNSDRSQAALRITSLMLDNDRAADAAAFVAQQRAATHTPVPATAAAMPAVGRNEPCPCGSGKKYKKCHGA